MSRVCEEGAEVDEMRVDTRGRQVMARIGFAERWLHRARRHCVDGNVTRGLLTLVLAEAEMQYALEAGGVSTKGGQRSLAVPTVLAVAALAAAVAVVASWLPATPPTPSAIPSSPIVKFATPVGTLLDLIQAPAATAPTPVVAVAPIIQRGSARPAVVQQVHLRVAPEVVSAPVTRPATAAVVVSPPPLVVQVFQAPSAPVISEVDLIDLAIAAERTLRSVPTNP